MKYVILDGFYGPEVPLSSLSVLKGIPREKFKCVEVVGPQLVQLELRDGTKYYFEASNVTELYKAIVTMLELESDMGSK